MSKQKKFFILGGLGRLGSSLSDEYAAQDVGSLARAVYADWWREEAPTVIYDYFKLFERFDVTIFVASGVMDPKSCTSDIMKVNYHLPINIIQGVKKLGFKVVTFGTVMERFLPNGNSYIQSKIALAAYVATESAGARVLHIQIHTLYGVNSPIPYMFLGGVLKALREQTPFLMTSGNQIREYHHISDDVKAIRLLEKSEIYGIQHLSHGDPVKLVDLAISIFNDFNMSTLLVVGGLNEPTQENSEGILIRPDYFSQLNFRKTLPAVSHYLQDVLNDN